MKKSLIRKYARLIARVGINVQKGQTVVLSIPAENEDFAVYLTEELYRAGAGKVRVEFSSDRLTKLDYMHQTLTNMK